MALAAEEDYFNSRLHEINDEMQKLLDRTSRERDSLRGPSSSAFVTSPSCQKVVTSPRASDTAAPASLVSLGPLERAFVEHEMRQLCREEMTRWMATDFPTLVNQAVEREVAKRLADVVRATEKMQSRQETNTTTIATLQKEWEGVRQQLLETASDMTRQQRHAESALRQDTDRYISGWRTDMDVMKDTISVVQRNAQLLERREEKRVAELAKHHLDLVHDKLSSLTGEVESWKSELYGLLRREVAAWRGQRAELDAQMARCEGVQRTQIEAVARHTASLSSLLEGNVEQRAEVRRCRRDVNRLEMLVQCAGVSESGAAAIDRAARNASQHQPVEPPGANSAVVQELFAAKDRIGFLSGRIEAIERRLHQVDHVIFQQRQQQQQQHEHQRQHGFHADTFSSPPREAVPAAPPVWDFPQRDVPTAHEQDHASAGGARRSEARGSPVEHPAATSVNGVPREAPRRHPQTADADRSMPLSTGGPRTGAAAVGAQRRLVGPEGRALPQRRPAPVVLPADSASDGEEPTRAEEMAAVAGNKDGAEDSYMSGSPLLPRASSQSPTPVLANIDARASAPVSGSVTPRDSYMSASATPRGSPVPSQSAALPGQYTPVPGSDTESDISNQKLSRLALD